MKVTFSALEMARADILSTRSKMTNELAAIDDDLRPVVAVWEGEAAQFYQAKQREWNTAAADIALVLDQIGRALGSANENYQQVEGRNRALWG